MPRAFFKRYLPSPVHLARWRNLGMLGSALADPELFLLNRRSVSTAFAVGLFLAFVPVPFQMLLAAMAAMFVRCNLPLAVALVWISNPVTFAPIFYFAYLVGVWVLDIPTQIQGIELSLPWLGAQVARIWQPLLVGCFLCGITASLIGWFSSNWIWRRQVIQRWERRHVLRRLRRREGP